LKRFDLQATGQELWLLFKLWEDLLEVFGFGGDLLDVALLLGARLIEHFIDGQQAPFDVLDRRQNNRCHQDDRPDHGADAGHHGALFDHHIDDKSVDDEHEPDQGLGQPNRDMFVVVGAARPGFMILIMMIMLMLRVGRFPPA
jgi:hypothetical protein